MTMEGIVSLVMATYFVGLLLGSHNYFRRHKSDRRWSQLFLDFPGAMIFGAIVSPLMLVSLLLLCLTAVIVVIDTILILVVYLVGFIPGTLEKLDISREDLIPELKKTYLGYLGWWREWLMPSE